MFIGHFAPAFAAAAISPRSPRLGTLFVAAQLVDWGFFALAMVGVEKMRVDPDATVMVPFDLYHMPFTHSLLGTAIWAAVFAIIVMVWQRNPFGGMLAALVVLSHWLLDWITHAPDLTIAGGPEAYGLGLWNYPQFAMPLELLITIGAFWFYVKRTRGPIGPPLALLAVLLVFQAINWFGPEPVEAGMALYVQALFAFGIATGFAWWVGHNRWSKRRGGLAAPSE
ncbi:MAG: metal-dependent hydrolase [Pseudomonadota bacterium]